MNIDFTDLINDYDLSDFSNSVFKSGDPNVARVNWKNALNAAEINPFINNSRDRRCVVSFFREFGAWEKKELDEMSDLELTALLIQYISGVYMEEMENEKDLDDDGYDGEFFKDAEGDTFFNLSM